MDYIWNITGRCNLRCQYCWDIFKDTEELDTKQAKRVIDQIIENPCDMLLFTGGEPLLRGDLFELIHYSKKQNVQHVKICTNGLLIEQRIEEIQNSPISEMHISLDNVREDADDFRKKNQLVLQNIKTLLQNVDLKKIKVVLVSVINYNKLGNFEEILKYAQEHDIYVTYQLPALVGKQQLNLHIEDAYPKQLEYLFKTLEEYHKRYPKQLDYFAKFYLLAAKKYYIENKIPEQCQAGTSFKIISPQGEFYSCYSCKNRSKKIQDCFESKCLVWFRSNNRAHKILHLLNT
jgi:MoaA/NifB/PqqE/SkfB family radical SAM enzyme